MQRAVDGCLQARGRGGLRLWSNHRVDLHPVRSDWMDFDAGEIAQRISCHKCNEQWTDVYKLAAVADSDSGATIASISIQSDLTGWISMQVKSLRESPATNATSSGRMSTSSRPWRTQTLEQPSRRSPSSPI